MEWLNYHHLRYFWLVVREGGVVPASRVLGISHPTVSAQLKQLEAALGQALFDRSGRRLQLTEAGRIAYRYADEIFSLGVEFVDAVRGADVGRPAELRVGITDVMPKLVVRRLLDPALHLGDPVKLICQHGRHDRLLAELALHSLDVRARRRTRRTEQRYPGLQSRARRVRGDLLRSPGAEAQLARPVSRMPRRRAVSRARTHDRARPRAGAMVRRVQPSSRGRR